MTRKHYIIWLILSSICCVLPLHTSFATGENTNPPTSPQASNSSQNNPSTSTTTEDAKLLTSIFNIFIKLASWGWTIVAFFAGKLMSNDWIYATWLWLDKTLFTMWNYMKNIANFVLWFLLVVWVLKSVFGKDAFELKKELPKYLLASIVINMSWFLMGALIDVANVATSAIGSFPQALIGENVMNEAPDTNVTTENGLKKLNVSIPTRINVNFDSSAWWCQDTTYDVTRSLDSIWARFNDMSWPLLFLWTSIYRFQSYCVLNQDVTSFNNFTIAQILKIIILFMFIAPLLALLFINLKRIFYIWLWIVFAPIIALLEIMKVKVDLWKMKDTFSFKEILWLIFQPIFTVWWLSIVLILSSAMYYVMWWTPWQTPSTTPVSHVYGGAEIISSKDRSSFSNTTAWTDITFDGDVFQDLAWYAWWFIGYIIITSFTIMLLWAIVKMSVSGSKIASSTYNSITSLGEKLVWWLPMIPVGGGKSVSLWSLGSLDNTFNQLGSSFTNKLWDQSRQNIQNTVFQSWLWKKLSEIYKFDNNRDQATKWDISLASSELNAIATLPDLMKKIKSKVTSDNSKVEYLNTQSNNFLKPLATRILEDKDWLKKQLGKALNMGNSRIDISWDKWKNLTADKLIDPTNDYGKAFIQYLKLNFDGKVRDSDGTPTNTSSISLDNLPSDFTIYKKKKRE